jgi:hypothetical protein
MFGYIPFLIASITTVASPAPPPIPYVSRDACPFECSTYGQWTAVAPIRVYSKERDTRQVAFTIQKGDTFRAVTGNVHVLQPGIARVLKSFSDGNTSYAAGDTIWLLVYEGEGMHVVWYRGTEAGYIDENCEWPPCDPNATSKDALTRLLRAPRTEWWVEVENHRGQTGWIKMPRDGPLPDGCDGC